MGVRCKPKDENKQTKNRGGWITPSNLRDLEELAVHAVFRQHERHHSYVVPVQSFNLVQQSKGQILIQIYPTTIRRGSSLAATKSGTVYRSQLAYLVGGELIGDRGINLCQLAVQHVSAASQIRYRMLDVRKQGQIVG